MYHVKMRKSNRIKRKLRIRSTIIGTSEKPRLSVFRSNKYIYAQLIDDSAGKTLASCSSLELKSKKDLKKTDDAFEIGKKLAGLAESKKIKMAVFDRNGYRYHGRVKAIADGAREGGLQL